MLVGIDVLNVERMNHLLEEENFLNKYFTEYEKEYITTRSNPNESLAGLFSAKEAFLKALGIGIGGGIDLKEIEINHFESGKPFIKLNSQKAKDKVNEFSIELMDISISHTDRVCTAICVLK